MLQALLEQRFSLRAHQDAREESGYILSVEKGGIKFKEAAPIVPDPSPGGMPSRPDRRLHPGNYFVLERTDMAQLADVLAHRFHSPVEDRTGLQGHYAISIDWDVKDSPDEAEVEARIREALKDLGLRFTSGKVTVPIVVVDSALKMPTPD